MTDTTVFDWDSEISCESSFKLLEEGDYEFEIVKFERARFPGSDKLPACNKAIVTFKITNMEITDNFLLCKTLEWKLSQFFLAIGDKKHGEKINMNWKEIVGKCGFCRVIVNKYRDKEGNERTNNRIERYYAYDEKPENAITLDGAYII